MCGIAGLVKKDGTKVFAGEIKAMTDALIHRGPDDEGNYMRGNIGLGHRRLSIIDLSEKGRQPMESHDGKYVIVFNGEIYNYVELKEELKKAGSRFLNDTDTEVILESYRYWGEDCVNHFNGMWSFVIFDRDREILFGSRDRLGVKPFCYINRDDVFAFASEPKGILELFPEERKYNPTVVYRFVKGWALDTDHQTFYKDILQLEPATSMIYHLKTNKIEKEKYWEIDADAIYERRIKGRNPVDEFKSLLEDAVRIRLRSDVEVGSSLSGGLDSSTLVGIISRKFHKRVNTFSSVYEDEDCNEKEYIDEVNQFAGTVPDLVYPSENSHLLEAFEKIVVHHDGPDKTGASLYSGYSVYQEANKSVKVLMDGQGADELLAGYLSSYNALLGDILSEKSLLSKVKAMKIISVFGREWPGQMINISTEALQSALGKRAARHYTRKRPNSFSKPVSMFYKEFEDCVDKSIAEHRGNVRGELNQELYEQLTASSLPAILHNVDGNSMAFSLEIRLPFLDYRVVEFCMALDKKYKIKNQWTKWILRKSCKEYLPEKVLYRTNKMGFPAPFGRWLRECGEKEEMRDMIFALGSRGIVREEAVHEYYRQHISGEADHSDLLCRFLTLEMWFRKCIY